MRLGEIAQRLGLELMGDAAIEIEGIAPLISATANQISFLSNTKFARDLAETSAACVIVKPEFQEQCPCAVLLSDNPYLSFAQLTALFDSMIRPDAGVHPSAVIGSNTSIHESSHIGPNVVIGIDVVIGENTVIEANTVVSDRCHIGNDCYLHSNVTVYHGVRIGDNVNIHSGAVIGADGFGFAITPEKKWLKIHQLGSVLIGNNVDIGANTCIDRGALEDTVIGDGVIIDNQVQIAHNCIIGDNTAIAGCVGIAGSTIIGKNCTLAGGVGVAGHLEIVDNVHVTSMSLVTGSILKPGSWSSGTSMMETSRWRKNAIRFSHLDDLYGRLKNLERKK